jgi:hypothetical protein
VHITIAKKDTFFGSEFEFSMVVGAKIRLTCAPKNTKDGIVWLNLIELLKRGLIVDDFAWCTVNKISGGDECFIQKF